MSWVRVEVDVEQAVDGDSVRWDFWQFNRGFDFVRGTKCEILNKPSMMMTHTFAGLCPSLVGLNRPAGNDLNFLKVMLVENTIYTR